MGSNHHQAGLLTVFQRSGFPWEVKRSPGKFQVLAPHSFPPPFPLLCAGRYVAHSCLLDVQSEQCSDPLDELSRYLHLVYAPALY